MRKIIITSGACDFYRLFKIKRIQYKMNTFLMHNHLNDLKQGYEVKKLSVDYAKIV